MKKTELYTSGGWINAKALLEAPEPFIVAIGGRGIGKTYGILKELYTQEIPFIYMRRTQSQVDAISVPQLNPFNQIANDIHQSIVSQKISKQVAGFYNGIEKDGKIVADGEPFGIAVALSTFSSIRSMSAEKYKVLFFDEIIPERHEKPLKEEGLAFANVLESLNRNREFSGVPLKVILATNSNTLNSKILDTLGLLNVVDKMNRANKHYENIDDLISVIRYIDSPISEKKKDTALYKVIKNKDFRDMSLSNLISESDYENVVNKPISEYLPLCSFENVTILKHKYRREYYAVEGVRSTELYNNLPLSKRSFNRKYYYVYGAMLDKRLYYQTAAVKIIVEGAFK